MQNKVVSMYTALCLIAAGAYADVSEMIFYPETDFSEGIVHFTYQGSQARNYGFVFDRGIDAGRILYARPAEHVMEKLKDGLLKLSFGKTTHYTYLQKLSRNDFVVSEENGIINILISGGDCMDSANCTTEENILTVAVPKEYRVRDYKALDDNLKELKNPVWTIRSNTYTLSARNVKGASIVMQLERVSQMPNASSLPSSAVVPEFRPVTLRNDRLFEKGEVKLSSGGKNELKNFAGQMEKRGGTVSVEGHTDNIPPNRLKPLYPTNIVLSEARAKCVAAYLRELGIKIEETRGYGESRPVASNSTEQGRMENGRIVLNVLP